VVKVNRQKGASLIEAITGLLVFVLVALAPNCIGCKRDYSTGRRTGIIVKFSKKGLALDSYEGTMHVGNAATAMGAATWDFSVADSPENVPLIRKLDAAQNSSVPVQIIYRQWWMKPAWIGTAYEAQEIQPVEEKR
jgi:hypothetical protein